MLIVARVFAQLIDIFLWFLIIVVSFLFVLPVFYKFNSSNYVTGILLILFINIIYLGVQCPFYINKQTIGKAFFALYVLPTTNETKVSYSLMFVREILLKVIFVYVGCVPAFLGKPALHEINTNTKVVVKKKGTINV